MYGIIYRVRNIINNKIYIGQTKDFIKRIYRHQYDAFIKQKDTLFCRALRKHGKENFEWKAIQKCKNLKTINQSEKKWIKKYKSNNLKFGYNLDSGGGKDKEISLSTKNKLSKIRKGMKLNEGWIKNIKKSMDIKLKDKNYLIKLSEGHRKINDKIVLKIFRMWKNGMNVREISQEIKYDTRTIRLILKKKPKYMKKFTNLKSVKFKRINLRIKRNDAWRIKQGISHKALFVKKDIIKIFNLFKSGKSRKEISKIFKTKYCNISSVLRKTNYVYYSRNL